MASSLVGKLADPDFRHRRASKAALARTSIDHHVNKIVDAWPELTEAQRSRLAGLLRPPGTEREAA